MAIDTPILTCPYCSSKTYLKDWLPSGENGFVVCPKCGHKIDPDELFDEEILD